MILRPGPLRCALVMALLNFQTQPFAAWAALCPETAGSPCKTVRDISEGVLQILQKFPSGSKLQDRERLKKVWDAMMPHMNSCEVAMRSLPADYLLRMTTPQKEEFIDIYSRLLVQTYSLALDRYTKSTEFRLIFDEERIAGGNARVRSRLITPKTEFVITYRLHREREKWLIYDVSYEGSSQVKSYRAQLDRIGKKFGYDYQMVRSRIKKRLKPALRHLPTPQIKVRFWGVCQRP